MGEKMVLEDNAQVETVLPRSVLRRLTQEEMEHYRRPFAEPGEGWRPTLAWARQIPIDGEPAAVQEVVIAYGEWLAHHDVPICGTSWSKIPLTCRRRCSTWVAHALCSHVAESVWLW